MDLSAPMVEPMLILSDGEVYFLRVIVPILLLLPWLVTLLFIILRWLLRWLASLKPKPMIPLESENKGATLVYIEAGVLKLKEIELLAKTNSRLAIIELSKYVRMVNISKGYEKLSLEYYLKETGKKWYKPWMDVLSTKAISLLGKPNDLFASIVHSSYQILEPTETLALELIEKVRLLKTKTKGKEI